MASASVPTIQTVSLESGASSPHTPRLELGTTPRSLANNAVRWRDSIANASAAIDTLTTNQTSQTSSVFYEALPADRIKQAPTVSTKHIKRQIGAVIYDTADAVNHRTYVAERLVTDTSR